MLGLLLTLRSDCNLNTGKQVRMKVGFRAHKLSLKTSCHTPGAAVGPSTTSQRIAYLKEKNMTSY